MKKFAAFLLLTILLGTVFALPAAATHMLHEGLDVTITMDKEEYADGEPITATITVVNTNATKVTITNLEQLIPDGYKLAEGSLVSRENVDLAPGQTLVLEVTFAGETTPEEEAQDQDFFDKLLYGETWGMPNILLALILVAAFAIFMWLT